MFTIDILQYLAYSVHKHARSNLHTKLSLGPIKGDGSYGQGGPKALLPTFEILKTCPSITSAPYSFPFFAPTAKNLTPERTSRPIFMYYRPIMHLTTATIDSISGNTAGRNREKQ